jgi:hypothetical protein
MTMRSTAADWIEDACLRADVLRQAYYRLLSGQQAASVSYLANGVQRAVTFSKIDLDALATELRLAEQLCVNGGATPRRIHTVLLSTSKGL